MRNGGCTSRSHCGIRCADALAVEIKRTGEENVTAAAQKGELLGEKLRAALEGCGCVGDVRGIGLMWGVVPTAWPATW